MRSGQAYDLQTENRSLALNKEEMALMSTKTKKTEKHRTK